MNLRLAFYGDDFTGSTDALEALELAGIRARLFLHPPSPSELAGFPGLEAAGVAGGSRTFTPTEMDAHLPAIFEALAALGAPLIHYKVCSTFDSSPTSGSIGRAIEIGRAVTGARPAAILAGAPALGRYCAFGHLFARAGAARPVHRIDRHPTMSRHPVTPMDESDLRLHLARQTPLRCALLDLLDLELDDDALDARLDEIIAGGEEMILFDVLRGGHLPRLGRLLDRLSRRHAPLFVAGSSGVEAALAAYWQSLPGGPRPPAWPAPAPVHQMLVVSGSCSPVTDRQIQWLLDHGGIEVPLDAAALTSDAAARVFEQSVSQVLELLEQGATPVVHTCRGPGDPRLAPGAGAAISLWLGRLLRAVLDRRRPPRTAILGGDTSVAAGTALAIRSLTLLTPIDPGAPLCLAHGGPVADNLEVIFKGGQLGREDFLGRAQGQQQH